MALLGAYANIANSTAAVATLVAVPAAAVPLVPGEALLKGLQSYVISSASLASTFLIAATGKPMVS